MELVVTGVLPEVQLKLRAPFAVLAARCDDYAIYSIEYLSPEESEMAPRNALAAELAKMVRAYLRKPRGVDFDLPLYDAATPHQRKVREAVRSVRCGETASYGDIARRAKTSPRAVGGACRANALPLIVPCHRIVAANGVGGFMGDNGESCLEIKRALLAHEGAL